MLLPLNCHWYASGLNPAAATLNVAVDPAFRLLLWGWKVICGAPFTVNVAGTLTAEPPLFDIITS